MKRNYPRDLAQSDEALRLNSFAGPGTRTPMPWGEVADMARWFAPYLAFIALVALALLAIIWRMA